MKIFKNINVSSNGSFYFCYNIETSLNNKLISFQKQDDKKFVLNQKKYQKSLDSKYSSSNKKKYLK